MPHYPPHLKKPHEKSDNVFADFLWAYITRANLA
jgi:hypothetical protein